MNSSKLSFSTDDSLLVEEKVKQTNGGVYYRRYCKGRLLGEGGFARCYEFTCMDSGKVSAAKIVSKGILKKKRVKQKLMSEIRIHRSLEHKHVVSFDRFFEDSSNIYILLGICRNQTMHELLARRKRLTEVEARCYLSQLISGLKYLHKQRVIHRDLKLRNLFLTDKMELKIGDFGLATQLQFLGDKRHTVCGTPNYIAPEIIAKAGHSFEVDVWALGIILYTVLVGHSPFGTPEILSTYERIQAGVYEFPKAVPISNDAKDLITSILNLDPFKRPTLDQILEHRFISGYATPALMPTSTLTTPPPNPIQPRVRKLSLLHGGEVNPFLTINSKIMNHHMTCKSSCHNYSLQESSPKIWVKQWIEVLNKCAIGYLMANGYYGISCNDSSNLLICSNQS